MVRVKNFKKFEVITVICFFAVLGFSTKTIFSQETTSSVQMTEDLFQYTVTDGKASIVGYTGTETGVNIPATVQSRTSDEMYPVTSIGKKAFNGYLKIETVTIPVSVTLIGASAFRSCTSLESITIPDSVMVIQDNAFNTCSNLQRVVLPNSVQSIGEYAFQYCVNLYCILIPNSVKTIGKGAFSKCTRLSNIILSNSLECIQNFTFQNCSSLQSLIIPDSVVQIGEEAFVSCDSLSRIVFNCPDTWYYTNSAANWSNKKNGTEQTTSISTVNVRYFTQTHLRDYWYKL